MPKCLPILEQYPPYGLSFDGSTGYVVFPDTSTLHLTSGFTIEVWLNLSKLGVFQDLVAKHQHGYAQGILLALDTNNKIGLWVYPCTSFYTNKTFTSADLGRWFCIHATWNGVDLRKLYVNGRFDNSYTQAITPATRAIPWALAVGHPLPSHPFQGMEASFKLYSRVLSDVEISRNARNPLNPVRDGLEIYTPMIEGYGITVKDFSGNGRNGTLYGGVSWRGLMKYEVQAL
jgi:hypothetical protein